MKYKIKDFLSIMAIAIVSVVVVVFAVAFVGGLIWYFWTDDSGLTLAGRVTLTGLVGLFVAMFLAAITDNLL